MVHRYDAPLGGHAVAEYWQPITSVTAVAATWDTVLLAVAFLCCP